MSESPEETIRTALREPYEVRGDGGIGRSVVNSAVTALEELIEERDGLKTKVEELETVLATLHKERTAGASY